MFTGFTDETVQFFLDLKFHNDPAFFHENHGRYIRDVQGPFYELIRDLSDDMLSIDPDMEIRPHKCLSRIHRDTRFSRDKSPYRDHHWVLFRKAAEPRDKSLFYFFEFGPRRLNWGMGVWGENRELFDQFRRRLAANPEVFLALIRSLDLEEKKLFLGGSQFKRISIPPHVPESLIPWYRIREMYVGKEQPDYSIAFSSRFTETLRTDFTALSPLYRYLRGCLDEA